MKAEPFPASENATNPKRHLWTAHGELVNLGSCCREVTWLQTRLALAAEGVVWHALHRSG